MGLEMVELILDVEDTFQISISGPATANCVTVADLQNIIVERLVDNGRTRNETLALEVFESLIRILFRNGYDTSRIRPDSKWIGDITKYG